MNCSVMKVTFSERGERIMKRIAGIIAVALLALSSAVLALDLDSAKSQGLVGEQPNGYLGVVKATPEAVELAQNINTRRRQAYERIARENGITIEQVANMAGQRAISRAEPGTWIRTPEGQWVER